MKKVIQPNVRKVYGAPSAQQQESQMNAVRKIHNLLSSGAVTVTGPTQPRILKQKMGVPSNVSLSTSPGTIQNSQTQIVQQVPVSQANRCYVCDEVVGNQCTLLSDSVTSHSNTKLPNKIGQLIGEAFMVIISLEDVICKRCVTMINHLDRLEIDFERVKSSLLNFIFKKYGLTDEDRHTVTSPPSKMQKLNTGNAVRKLIDDEQDMGTRKISAQTVQRDTLDNQMSNMFEGNEKPAQTKIVNQTPQNQQQTPARKGPIKIYKCMSCEFKTTDLKQFQPHYETCRQQNGFRCKTCKKIFVNMTTLKQHVAEKHPNEYNCNICNTNFLNEITLKKHMELNHSENKSPSGGGGGVVASAQTLHSCNLCQYKTTDKANFDDHQRKHVKVKPFKCRICSVRFETREQASIHAKSHQPNYYKCGTCSASFTQREMLVKHFETHQKQQPQQPQQQQSQQTGQQSQHVLSTQKLLQDTIDEALRESDTMDNKGIHFFSCNICSVTFIQENYYNQHMEMHKRENKKGPPVGTTTTPTTSQSLIRQEMRNTNLLTTTAQGSSISETDIESIFEKMHSDKAENEANSNSSENLVITSQENAVGGITFNITIPRPENANEQQIGKTTNKNQVEQPVVSSASGENVSVGIDMPVLDQPDDSNQRASEEHKMQMASEGGQQEQVASGPVSMPSLDDEGDSQSQPSNTDQVPMDLEDMQHAVEGNQIKFILNENGQILQLDNHIITTDADGNQILVQGTDSEQIQQLLQSVGVLQSADGLDGELQMIGDNNQMIIVQQGDNEAQLIDASLLNADGHIVIQQSQDGDMSEGAHAIGEDGVRIPVSVAYTTNEQGETVAIHTQQEQSEHENSDLMEQQSKTDEQQEKANESAEENARIAIPVTSEQQIVTTTQSLPTSTGESFFALEDLMQQSEQKATE